MQICTNGRLSIEFCVDGIMVAVKVCFIVGAQISANGRVDVLFKNGRVLFLFLMDAQTLHKIMVCDEATFMKKRTTMPMSRPCPAPFFIIFNPSNQKRIRKHTVSR
jgi:hypothetical protein